MLMDTLAPTLGQALSLVGADSENLCIHRQRLIWGYEYEGKNWFYRGPGGTPKVVEGEGFAEIWSTTTTNKQKTLGLLALEWPSPIYRYSSKVMAAMVTTSWLGDLQWSTIDNNCLSAAITSCTDYFLLELTYNQQLTLSWQRPLALGDETWQRV